MAHNCINCGGYCGDILSITPHGLVPVCGPDCLRELNNSDAPLDKLQQMYLDNYMKNCEDERRRKSNT